MNPTVILDGGMGRELLRRGAPFRQPEWSALALTEAPDRVREIHLDFVRAGAQVLTANSYALVPFHIGSRFAAEAESLAALSGRLACEAAAAGRDVRVAASLPPLFGSYRPQHFRAAEAPALALPLIRGLAPYADIWLAETVSSLAEAHAWRQMLPQDGKPFWLSFTLNDDWPAGCVNLRSGESVAEAAAWAVQAGASALLFNCSRAEVMETALTAARAVLDGAASAMRLGAYANAFEPAQAGIHAANDGLDDLRADLSPQAYLDYVRRWLAAGADTVGGCCGISPAHIRVLAEAFGCPAGAIR
ncbi:homocysteine S-methyltransferase family protein [Neisseria leonii]|uniref:Homocysteine S-methyltransferase family protein n=1 Tax=Neisseria leonii TaxID=2995413 RepID=A0A9X4E3V2_9NEIS|nr:homocysteine S-methyltransferase family protein [Neisseria sp. 51.81]MDD9327496.1 homocysteine S-methyltransferase family protein [Neisseria sp. 51.81]